MPQRDLQVQLACSKVIGCGQSCPADLPACEDASWARGLTNTCDPSSRRRGLRRAKPYSLSRSYGHHVSNVDERHARVDRCEHDEPQGPQVFRIPPCRIRICRQTRLNPKSSRVLVRTGTTLAQIRASMSSPVGPQMPGSPFLFGCRVVRTGSRTSQTPRVKRRRVPRSCRSSRSCGAQWARRCSVFLLAASVL